MTRHLMRSRTVLLALAALALAPAPPARAQETFDHLKCFAIRDRLPERTVLATDLLPEQKPPFADQRCKVRLPARFFCVDVRKENVLERGLPRPLLPIDGDDAGDYLCYRLRCPREGLAVGVADQFAGRIVSTRLSDLLCIPARKVS
jgi:hypothetical protein